MAANQPLWPRRWLMTNERMGDRLWQAIERLPMGGGIIFRHYSLADADRLELGMKLAERSRELNLVLGVAGSRMLAERIGAALVHNPDGPGDLASSMAVHDQAEASAARQGGADLAFIAPIYPTRSHPGRPALGAKQAVELAHRTGCLAVALGGMDEVRFAQLESAHPGAFHGFAGIDCWLAD